MLRAYSIPCCFRNNSSLHDLLHLDYKFWFIGLITWIHRPITWLSILIRDFQEFCEISVLKYILKKQRFWLPDHFDLIWVILCCFFLKKPQIYISQLNKPKATLHVYQRTVCLPCVVVLRKVLHTIFFFITYIDQWRYFKDL